MKNKCGITVFYFYRYWFIMFPSAVVMTNQVSDVIGNMFYQQLLTRRQCCSNCCSRRNKVVSFITSSIDVFDVEPHTFAIQYMKCEPLTWSLWLTFDLLSLSLLFLNNNVLLMRGELWSSFAMVFYKKVYK